MKTSLSIVVPVYNSEKSLEALFKALKNTLFDYNFEVIFVDDASVDNSWSVLKEIKSKNKASVKIIQLENNIGQHRATLVGFKYTSEEIIVTIDDDLQHSPNEIKKLLKTHISQKNDVTYGIYLDNKKHSILRNLASAYIKITSFFSSHKNKKGSSFRVLSKKLVNKLSTHINEFVYIDEIVHSYTKNIDFVEIEHLKRFRGESSYNFLKLLHLYSNILTTYYIKRIKKSLFFISIIVSIIIMGGKIILETSLIYWQIRFIILVLIIFPLIVYYMFWFSLFIYCLCFNRNKLRKKIIPYQIKQHL